MTQALANQNLAIYLISDPLELGRKIQLVRHENHIWSQRRESSFNCAAIRTETTPERIFNMLIGPSSETRVLCLSTFDYYSKEWSIIYIIHLRVLATHLWKVLWTWFPWHEMVSQRKLKHYFMTSSYSRENGVLQGKQRQDT